MLEQANGADLAVILAAAGKADCATHDHGPGEYNDDIDVAEFASDCAMMAMGTGVGWFDDHAYFDVPYHDHMDSTYGRISPVHRSKFVVPAYELAFESAPDE